MHPNARRLMCVAASAFLLGFAGFAPQEARAASARIVKGPYLQSLSARGVEVRAELDAPAPVTITVKPPRLTDAGAPRVIRDATSSVFHAVRIDGLRPATRYEYEVRAGSEVERGEFTTAPNGESNEPFTFLIYGDNRTDDVAHAAVVKTLAQAGGDFLLHTGDFVQNGGDAPEWQQFFAIERPLLRDRCVFSCVGNHELLEAAGTSYLRYFGSPTGVADAADAGGPPQLFGTFRWGNTRFFLLNAMEELDSGPDRAWLDDALARADREPGLAWRIAVLHQGPWSSGPHGGNPRLLRAKIPELLAEHHVDLVVSGHDHIYERGYESSLRYLVSGGGGAPLYPLRDRLPGTRKAESAHHYVEAKVSADAIALVTKRDDGSVLERCGFAHGVAGWDCDPPPPPVAAPASAPASLTTPPAPRSSTCGCAVPGASRGFPFGVASFALAIGLLLAVARRR